MRIKILGAALVLVVVAACFGALQWWRGIAEDGFGCYTTSADTLEQLMHPDSVAPVDCDQPHDFEAVAQVEEAGAEERCRQEAEAFLGGPWEQSRAVFTVLRPADGDRGRPLCAVAETSGVAGEPVGSLRSLRDGMRGDRPLAITCLVSHPEDGYLFGDCAESHAAELAGVVPPGAGAEAACLAAAAAFVGVSDLGLRGGDLTVERLPRENELCLVTEAPDPSGRHDSLRGSVRGLGTGPLPV